MYGKALEQFSRWILTPCPAFWWHTNSSTRNMEHYSWQLHFFNLEHYFLPRINDTYDYRALRLSFNISLYDCITKQHTKVSDLAEIQYTVMHFSCLHSWTQINAGNRYTRKNTRKKLTHNKSWCLQITYEQWFQTVLRSPAGAGASSSWLKSSNDGLFLVCQRKITLMDRFLYIFPTVSYIIVIFYLSFPFRRCDLIATVNCNFCCYCHV
jgi:hypothetical protein